MASDKRSKNAGKVWATATFVIMLAMFVLALGILPGLKYGAPQLYYGTNTIEYIVDGKKYFETCVKVSDRYEIDVPQRTGYDFLGLYSTDNGEMLVDKYGVVQSAFTNYSRGKTIEAKASWQEKEYEIKFDVNGGDGRRFEEKKISYGEDMPDLRSDMTKTGYDFTGWATDQAGTKMISGSDGVVIAERKDFVEGNYNIPEDSNVVYLYAQWAPQTYSVTLDVAGGTLDGENVVTATYNTILDFGVPARTGYTFLGWYLDKTEVAGKNGIMTSVWSCAEDKTLTAKWEINTYEVTLTSSTKGGTVTGPNGKIEYGKEVEYTVNVNDGYSFDGWYVEGIKKSEGTTYSFQMPANDIAIVAKWTVNEYNVTLNANGGALKAESECDVIYGTTRAFEVPTRSGYTFVGWYLGTTAITDNIGVMTHAWNYLEDKELTAKWNANTYDITLTTEVNGGTASGPEDAKCDEEVTFVATTLAGYTFDGWYVGGIRKSTETTYHFQMSANDVAITAKWTANEYNVTLNANGGALKAESECDVIYGTTLAFEVPTRSGYAFVGWYLGTTAITDSNGAMLSVWGYAEDKVLTAKWEEKTYKIILTSSDRGGNATAPDNAKCDASVECIANVEEGYAFDGWYINGVKESSDIVYNFEMPAKDIQINAKWNPNKYNITLNASGGALSSTNVVATYDSISSFAEPTRTGYTFLGWYFGNVAITDATGTMLSAWTYTEDKELIANWQINKYKVTLSKNLDGGSVSGSEVLEYNTQSTYTATTNSGYTFDGWYINENKVCSESTYTLTMPASDVTLTAKWKANTYVATLDAGEGTLSSSNTVNVEYNTKPTFPVPTRTGYTFLGWYLGSTAVTFSSGVMKSAWTHTENKEFSARWAKNSYALALTQSVGGTANINIKTATAEYNEEVILTATTQAGYIFNGWYVNGTYKGSKEKYAFSMPAQSVNVYAQWDIDYFYNEMKDYSFDATILTETAVQGKAKFKMTGIPVIYEGSQYIYGNAYYEGYLGGTRFDDVARITLEFDDTKALFGGSISWCGTQGESNESGAAGWDPTTKRLSYLQKNPTDDFAGDEYVRITINGLCIRVGNGALTTKEAATYPEIIKSSFSANIYTESTNQGRAQFDFYGLRVVYNNSVYAYGCAYYNGCTGGSRFNNVAKITLINSSKEILSGGNFFYRGKENDANVSGVYSSAVLKVNSTSCEYMAENGDNDFPGNENVTISIVNMCIKLDESVGDSTRYLKMVEKKVNAIIYAEAQYEDYVAFTVLGMEVHYKGKKAILGWASYKGKINGNRLNDCDCITLKFDDGIAVQGGYLHYTGNYDDWKTQSTLSSYSNGLTKELKYWGDVCWDDFPGKDATQTTIYISGICVLQ